MPGTEVAIPPLAITLVIIIAVFVQTFRKKHPRKLKYAISSFCLSIGLAGTFIGIVIALWNIDPENPVAGIPMLVAGIKVSFISSIFGLIASIAAKYIVMKSDKSESTFKENFDSLTINLSTTLSRAMEDALKKIPTAIEQSAHELYDSSKQLQSVSEQLASAALTLSESMKQHESWLTMTHTQLASPADLKEDVLATLSAQQRLLKNYDTLTKNIEDSFNRLNQEYFTETKRLASDIQTKVVDFDAHFSESLNTLRANQDTLIETTIKQIHSGVETESEQAIGLIASGMKSIIKDSMTIFTSTAEKLNQLALNVAEKSEAETKKAEEEKAIHKLS